MIFIANSKLNFYIRRKLTTSIAAGPVQCFSRKVENISPYFEKPDENEVWIRFNSRKDITGPVERVKPDCKYQGHDDDLLDLDIVHLCPLLPGAGGIGK